MENNQLNNNELENKELNNTEPNNNEYGSNELSGKPVRKKKTVPLGVFIVCVVLALLVGGSAAGAAAIMSYGSSDDGDKIDPKKIQSLKRQIDKYYKGDYKEEDLVDGAYHGYIDGLGDQYSAYLNKEEYKDDLESYSGNYSGIGITFGEDDDGNYEITEVTEGCPADKEGMKPGDLILKVDGEYYDTTDQMAHHMRGEEGTKVKVEYLHDDQVKEAELIRKNIHQQTVKHEMLDKETGLIEINSFIETTGADFEKAMDDIESKGAKYLILDLRDNGGGLVDECVKVADEFLDKGVICHVEDKNGRTETYDAENGKTGLKTVVLVNEYSASASEILS